MAGAEPREFQFLSLGTESGESEINSEENIEINLNGGAQPNSDVGITHDIPSNVNLNESLIDIHKILDELEQLKEEKQHREAR